MCGIIGIYNFFSNTRITNEIQKGLQALQHRGQDSHGYLLDYKNQHKVIKHLGLIKPYTILNSYKTALGHTRYATSKNTSSENSIQPLLGNHSKLGEFYLIHNGNINNLKQFNSNLDLDSDLNDSHMLVRYIETNLKSTFEGILTQLITEINGIYNLLIYHPANDTVYALKDKFGNRPLCIGNNRRGYCIASESVALLEYDYLREIKKGELVRIDNNGEQSIFIHNGFSQVCLFEYIYLQKPDSLVSDKHIAIEYEKPNLTIRDIRKCFGEELARKETYTINFSNRNNIVVIGAPNTGIPIGEAFAKKLDIPYQQFLQKKKGTHRSFIQKDTQSRLEECSKKFLRDTSIDITNKIVFFVDDSLVRGNTIKSVINLLKSFKPKEIHFRISSPEVKYPCYNGIDIPTKEELIMNHYSIEEFIKELDIQSLIFLSTTEMEYVLQKNVGFSKKNTCMSCFDGKYHPLLDF